MTLLPDERQMLDDIIATAYDDHGPVLRDVAIAVVAELSDLSASGIGWVQAVLDDWLVVGAKTEVQGWMRRQPGVAGKTKRGSITEVPAFGGVRVLDSDGHVQYVQLRLLSMTRAQLAEHVKPKRKQRDTMSRGLSFYDSILADMEAHSHGTVADALVCMDDQSERRVS